MTDPTYIHSTQFRRQASDDCNCGVIRWLLFCLAVAVIGVVWLVMPL